MKNLILSYLHQVIVYVDESLYVMTWVDALDVSVMAVFLCLSLVWVQRRTSWTILFAVFPMLITFVLAKSLKMYLTSKVFQIGLTALSVSIVIIFQDDFRRAFESLSSWRLWGKKKDSALSGQVADTLVECLFAFGNSKTGALIVIGGRQALNAHLRAGIPVHGQVSGPLLQSIFDPNSPGHDGAVIITNGVLEKFGAHLPLSRNSDATGRLGTRHAAALGLAEKCDALVLVVSEETGTVSLARNGKLVAAKNEGAVKDAIRDQYRRLRPLPHRSLLEIPWGRLAASFLLSFALWTVFARPVNLVQRMIEVPIVYRGLPKAWEAKQPDPVKVRLTLLGPQGSVLGIEPGNLSVTLDLSKAREGQQNFVISESNLVLPPHIRIKRIEPSEVSVHAYTTLDYSVPVALIWLEGLERSPSSAQVRLTPTTVSLRIPRSASPPKVLETEPVDAKELKKAGKMKVKLRLPKDVQMSGMLDPEVDISLIK